METSSATDIIPEIIPCCYGKEVGVEPEIINTGLSAISIKRTSKRRGSEDVQAKSYFENRNSFFNLHRPEMTKINWVSTSPRKIKEFFHNHATKHGPFCAYLHEEDPTQEEDFHCILPPNEFQYNEEDLLGMSSSIGTSVLLRSCSMQLSDDDLSPSSICHRSRAEFCVTIGVQDATKNYPKESQTMADSVKMTEGQRRESKFGETQNVVSPLAIADLRSRLAKTKENVGSSLVHTHTLQGMSSIGQSKEVATFSPKNISSSKTTVHDSPFFSSTLEPQNQATFEAEEDSVSPLTNRSSLGQETEGTVEGALAQQGLSNMGQSHEGATITPKNMSSTNESLSADADSGSSKSISDPQDQATYREKKDTVSPFTNLRSRGAKTGKNFGSALPRPNLSNMGQSREIMTVTPTNLSSTNESLSPDLDSGSTGEEDSTSFRSILEPREQTRDSFPNEMTEADEAMIRSLQNPATPGAVARPLGRGNYQKMKPTSAATKPSQDNKTS